MKNNYNSDIQEGFNLESEWDEKNGSFLIFPSCRNFEKKREFTVSSSKLILEKNRYLPISLGTMNWLQIYVRVHI